MGWTSGPVRGIVYCIESTKVRLTPGILVMEPIAHPADTESALTFQNGTRPTRAPSSHIGSSYWKREGLRLSQSMEVCSRREAGQKHPDREPKVSVQGEGGRKRE